MATVRSLASKVRRRARLALLRDGRRRSREPKSWEIPPALRLARPDLVVAMVASDRLCAGFADQWTQQVVPPGAGTLPAADFVLVELDGDQIPGCGRLGEPSTTRLVQTLGTADAPVVLWITAGGPPAPGARAQLEPLLKVAGTVLVADLVDQWRELVPDVVLLEPAAEARRTPRPRGRDAREGRGLIVSSGVGDQATGAPVAELITSGLAPLADRFEAVVTPGSTSPRALLPQPFGDAAGVVGYEELAAALRRSDFLLDGPRRSPGDTWNVLAAAAAGTPVVSVAGLALPSGLTVPAPDSAGSLRAEVVARLNQLELIDREAVVQRRAVLDQHTFAHRAQQLLGAVGRPEPTSTLPSVSAVVPTNRAHELDNVFASIGRQSYAAVELVLVLHGLELDEAALRARAQDHGVGTLQVVDAPSHLTLGACMNLGIEAASGDLVAKMDDDNYYGRNYLSDLVAALRAQGAGIAGKWGHYVWLRSTGAVVLRYPKHEHRWVRRIQGGSMLFEGDVVRDLRFGDLPRAVDSDILDRAMAAGISIWSADRYNYVSVRGEDNEAHTWTVEDATFMTASGRLTFFGDPRAHVEV